MINVFYFTLLAITTLFWGYIFYKKDYHPQPLKVVYQSFLMGLFSMVPVFAYKYAYQHFLPGLAEYQIFRPLLDSPILSGLTVFILNLIALSLILFILSGFISILLNFFNHYALVNLKNAIKDEPLGFTMVSMLLGGGICLQVWSEKFFATSVIGTAGGAILFLAAIEEYIKHLMVRITDDSKIKDIDDAITLSIIVGLAFAFIETVIYGFIIGEMNIVFFRMIVSIPIHLVASGIFGYYYGLAHFAKPITELKGGEKIVGKAWLPKLLTLKISTVYHEEKMVEGIFFATVFHAAMNLFFEFNLGFLAIPFIVLGILVIFRMYKKGQSESRLIDNMRKARHAKIKLRTLLN
jgi:RsiW-degrading membrane proteinase PrsW (M82 family)